MHQVCLSSQCDFASCLDVFKSLGVQRTALWNPMIDAFGEKASKKVWDASGLVAESLCVSELFEGEDKLKMMLERAEKFGARTLVIITGGFEPDDKGGIDTFRKRVVSLLMKADEMARPYNVKLAFEPLHPMVCGNRSIISSLAEALWVLERLDGEHQIGLAIDCYALWWEHDLAEKISKAGKFILNYHVSDWLHDTKDLRLDRGMPGDGQIDLIQWRHMIEQADYTGPVEVEIFSKNRWWNETPESMVKEIIQRMNKFY